MDYCTTSMCQYVYVVFSGYERDGYERIGTMSMRALNVYGAPDVQIK